MDDQRGLKRFSGEDDDAGKSLKRWRAWASAMLSVKDLPAKQRGQWLFTLLDGKALEACEHLTLTELATEDGENRVWKLLTERFPEKEKQDQMGEALGEVFALAAKDGETMKEWTARVMETFERCRRKAAVDFPVEARGWIALHCAGFSEEQKAIVKAKTQGKLDLETISAGIRSCFPSFKASNARGRKPTSVLIAEEEPVETETGPAGEFFEDVESFLADHNLAGEGSDDIVSEDDAAEALAVTWKERRAEINRLNKSRQFSSADNTRKSFRIEVEELKRRTKCRRCGRVGHWARECRARVNAPARPGQSSSANQGASSASGKSGTETLYVENPVTELADDVIHFVGAAVLVEEVCSASLVSSPGFGVIDSGCGKTLIGAETLAEMEPLLKGRKVVRTAQRNMFRFGNGEAEESTVMARIPVAVAGKTGIID